VQVTKVVVGQSNKVTSFVYDDLDPVSWTRGFVRFSLGGLVASGHGTRRV
jgi:hypothetical protein